EFSNFFRNAISLKFLLQIRPPHDELLNIQIQSGTKRPDMGGAKRPIIRLRHVSSWTAKSRVCRSNERRTAQGRVNMRKYLTAGSVAAAAAFSTLPSAHAADKTLTRCGAALELANALVE